jgi:hypothetical protein
MSFNIKEFQLQSGSLIRFDEPVVGFSEISPGKIGIVLAHEKPAFLNILVEGRLVKLNFSGAVSIHGWISTFTLVVDPEGYPGCARRMHTWRR